MQASKKIKQGIDFLKLRWSTPAPGEKTNLKEFLSYCVGTLGICGFTFVCSEMVAFTAGYFCGFNKAYGFYHHYLYSSCGKICNAVY